ncbi:hypothetical protein KQI65_16345 [bacterium]|nr:hypothetical protein [bacterium]
MKTRMMMTAILGVLLIPVVLTAQPRFVEEDIVVQSCDGDIRISDMALELRDYVLVVESAEEGLINLRDYDAGVTATLDLRNKKCFCLSVFDGEQEMKVHCCWKDVRVPQHADIWNKLTDHDRAFFGRTALHNSLIAALQNEVQ